MKVTLQSTVETTMHGGMLCRVWEGRTEGGVSCYALIPVIAHHKEDDDRASEFFTELVEHEQPTERALQCFDIRQVL